MANFIIFDINLFHIYPNIYIFAI